MSGENIVVKPNFCRMNLDITTNKTRSFESEPGIPELGKLYYDDYNFDQGGFTGMTESMKKIYKKDVDTFYKLFTHSNSVPPEIKTFSDIPLRSYQTDEGCKPNGIFTVEYKGTVKDKLFKEYADHIKKMMTNTEDNQNKLLDIIDKIFVFNVNPITKEREVTIKPDLTEDELQKIVDETRQIIINLYITCENDFFEGLLIFEAIVENQIKNTSQMQINELQKIANQKLSSSSIVTPTQNNPVIVPAPTSTSYERSSTPGPRNIESSPGPEPIKFETSSEPVKYNKPSQSNKKFYTPIVETITDLIPALNIDN